MPIKKLRGKGERFVDPQILRYRKYRKLEYIKETKQKLGRPKGGKPAFTAASFDFFGVKDDD